MSVRPVIGIIAGTGLGEELSRRGGVERLYIETPFGPTSAPLLKTRWHGADVLFLNRHGDGHVYPPASVPYRANVFALKKAGATHVIASGAVGSLSEQIEPAHLVICDQVIDKTTNRPGTFFDEGIAVHAELADPFCPALRLVLIDAGGDANTKVHQRGTYVVMQGPQFSTRAESHMHRQWGGDLIGMTCMPEARLAREAELCYALVALATDYDCWREHQHGDKQALIAEILGNLKSATQHAIRLIEVAIQRIADSAPTGCNCRNALEMAIWSDKTKVEAHVVRRLEPLVGRYFADNKAV